MVSCSGASKESAEILSTSLNVFMVVGGTGTSGVPAPGLVEVEYLPATGSATVLCENT